MTAKQRAARAKFKAVVAEAKKLRKKNPKLTQAQAVKQAFAISYSKKRAGKKLGETHKDTKSHNVNIRVVSGIKKKKKIGSAYLDRLKEQQAKAERERETERTKRQRPAAASKRVREVLKRQGLKMPSGYKVAERVISGISDDVMQKLQKAVEEYNMAEDQIVLHKGNLLTLKKMKVKQDDFTYKLNRKQVTDNTKLKKELKKYINSLKRLINV